MNFSLPRIGRGGRVLISDSGEIADGYAPTRDLYPDSLQQKCADFEKELTRIATRFLRLLRWQQAIEVPPYPIQHVGLYWQVNPGSFYHVGELGGRTITSASPAGIMWEEEDQAVFRKLWKAKRVEEPLAHELLREAVQLAEGTPRSSLLIAGNALEIGVKWHISKLVPAAQWLVENVPSPPIFKMLRDYVPQRRAANRGPSL